MSNHIKISTASELTGLTTAVIRIWELRYGWPRPKRGANGYRMYSQADIDNMKRIRDLVKSGTPIGAILMDGSPHWPTSRVSRSANEKPCFDSIPQPTTSRGQVIRSELEAAIAQGDRAHVEMARHLVPTIHPRDRGPAVLDVLRAAGAGFTLIEVMIVISIIAIIAVLTISNYQRNNKAEAEPAIPPAKSMGRIEGFPFDCKAEVIALPTGERILVIDRRYGGHGDGFAAVLLPAVEVKP